MVRNEAGICNKLELEPELHKNGPAPQLFLINKTIKKVLRSKKTLDKNNLF
jgi:hypothetical protein